MKVGILDGYVDEPSCLGVPPYISPYPRYIWGMLKHLRADLCGYFTIDEFRKDGKVREKLSECDILIVIAGAVVPGKYLGGVPLSKRELPRVACGRMNILVGPLTLELTKNEREELHQFEIVEFPFEERLFELLCNIFHTDAEFDLNEFALRGAEVVRFHPEFPHVICEMETYRGCYWSKCSFCVERFQRFMMREPKCVLAEFERLYSLGVRHFRLGRQTDFLTYMADFNEDFPKPEPEKMRSFHEAIWRLCPEIKTLHLDNINPKTIAMHPEESRAVLKTIVRFQTAGNVAVFGMETADERVVRANNLAAMPEEVLFAVEMVNSLGRERGANGMPKFLPGLNFVTGLKGETKETYEKNYEFLNMLLERNLLLRRINIRQVKILPGTPMAEFGYKNVRKHKKYFKIFKRKVREYVDREMLRRILPLGTVLRDLRCEVRKGKVTFARQFGSYPLLVGIIGEYERNNYVNAKVIDYGMRSITAIEYPLDVNKAKLYQLEAIPGVGSRTAARIVANRPFKRVEDLKEVVGEEEFSKLKDFVCV
ncbi:MAG: Radical SAM superfamily enzyme with C-terminal helix-hairpin-helix motif [Methanophagales archaeon]|nr:helix-hairpin-helix domain-containing protein [Methanophagales archaeon]MCU4140852.1 Radical SAM superfamily enzyme with C-terminal helix-hairpin-helix motif [Methanophagales archaeon]